MPSLGVAQGADQPQRAGNAKIEQAILLPGKEFHDPRDIRLVIIQLIEIEIHIAMQ